MKTKKILLQIAENNGVGVIEVRRNIEEAIEIGWNNPDPKVQAYWKQIPCKKAKPTLDEVVEYLSKEVNNDLYIK